MPRSRASATTYRRGTCVSVFRGADQLCSIARIQAELEGAKAAHAAADDKVTTLQEEHARALADAESSKDALVAEREGQLKE